MNKQPAYEASHPVAVALAGMARAVRHGCDLLDALAEQARDAGVTPWSDDFDQAAALVGYHYSRELDLYVDREDLAQPARLH